MSARQDVVRILSQGGLEHIDFYLNGRHISRAALTRVRDLVESGRIHVYAQGPDGGAHYTPADNSIVVPRSDRALRDWLVEAAVAHEAIHAWMDSLRATTNDPAREEALAYIVQVLYLDKVRGNWHGVTGLIFEEAYRVVEGPDPNDHRRNMRYARGVVLTNDDVAPLRSAVLASPTYEHLRRVPRAEYHDGIGAVTGVR